MLPIVQRELTVGSRRWTTFWARTAAAGIGFVLLLMFLPGQGFSGIASGQFIFETISAGAWYVSLFSGAVITADSLARERREGTLGLLFLTDLKGYDVVLGKLAAYSVTAIFCLTALLPVLAVPMLMGGVTLPQVCRVSAALLSTLLLSLSVGMVASVLCRVAQNAIAVAVFLSFLIWCLVHLLNQLGAFFQPWAAVSPLAALRFSKPSAYAGDPATYYVSICTTIVAAALFLAFASNRIGKSWQIRPSHGYWLLVEEWWRNLFQGNATYRRAHRKRLLDVNPILWMHSRARLIQRTVNVAWISLLIGCYALNWNRSFYWWDPSAIMVTALFPHVVFFGLLAVESSHYLIRTREDGVAELILSTGLTTNELVYGHYLAARRMFRLPASALIIFHTAWLATALYFVDSSQRWFITACAITMIANVLSGGRSAVWCALASSLYRKRPLMAAASALFQMLVFPWLFWILIGASAPHSPVTGVLVLLAVLLCTQMFAAGIAKQRLSENFRMLLSDPPRALTRKEFEEKFRVE